MYKKKRESLLGSEKFLYPDVKSLQCSTLIQTELKVKIPDLLVRCSQEILGSQREDGEKRPKNSHDWSWEDSLNIL